MPHINRDPSVNSKKGSVTDREGPNALRICPQGLQCSYWSPAEKDFSWTLWPKPAQPTWASLLDLPAEFAPNLTLGDFIGLFDISDSKFDQSLFDRCIPTLRGSFRRWVDALKAAPIASIPSHLVAMEVELDAHENPAGEVLVQDEVPALRVVSQGRIDHEFWRDWSTWHWMPGSFALCDLALLPLRLSVTTTVGPVVVRRTVSFRRLIQSVFGECAPANHWNELDIAEFERLGGERFSPGVESLEEMLGLAAPGTA